MSRLLLQPQECIKDRCYSPVACNGFGYCREKNFKPSHRLAWRDIPINQLTREQMIECIEGLYRNNDALREERDEYLDRWLTADQVLYATIKDFERIINGCGND